MQAELTRLRAELAELRAACEPFVIALERAIRFRGKFSPPCAYNQEGDYRRLAEAMKEKT